MKSDPKDWFVMILVAGIWIASSVFIFKHPDNTAFGIWAGLAGTIGGIYHFLAVHDDKNPDRREDHVDGPH